MKVLFLPFLRIPSGHHQTARALSEALQEQDPNIECQHVDILSYSYGLVESAVSASYLKWIHSFPRSYSWLYRRSVCREKRQEKPFKLYEILFKPFMKRLLKEQNPDLIVCTHALPSYMISRLKDEGYIETPAVNVYTDYFIHEFWGIRNIDYHFVGMETMKGYLKGKNVDGSRIFITGIPTHSSLTGKKEAAQSSSRLKGIIMGGSLGAGELEKLLKKIGNASPIEFLVLCGKNNKLYEKIKNSSQRGITAFPYISSRKKMDALYEESDFIITKPGGVTISECLKKRLPIFIYHALPGQEEINLKELSQSGLVHDFLNWENSPSFHEEIISKLSSEEIRNRLDENLNRYHNSLHTPSPADVLHEILQQVSKPMLQ